MSRDPHHTGPQPPSERDRMSEQVERKARRRLEARRQRDYGVWFGLGMFGLVGWSIAIPTLLGILVGIGLDRRGEGGISWTITFLFVGVAIGCLNAWYWVKRESRKS